MKKVTIIAVGKIKESYYNEAIEEYLKRLSRFCSVKIVEIADCEKDAAVREGRGILDKASRIDFLLDVGGDLVTSEDLSRKIQSVYATGGDNVTFVIGGSEGVSGQVKAAAKSSISFGRVTFPHRLMRVILMEQLYRAFTISAGLPYHK